MPSWTQNATQEVVSKSIPSQRGHKTPPNICWPNTSLASVDSKCISTCVYQTLHVPARTLNASQHFLAKSLPFQQGHKIYLKLCWPNPSHGRVGTMCIWTCVDQTPPSKAQNLYYHVWTNPLPWQLRIKLYLKIFLPNSSQASADTKFMSIHVLPNATHSSEEAIYICTGVFQTHPMAARTQNSSQLVLIKPLPCQWGH